MLLVWHSAYRRHNFEDNEILEFEIDELELYFNMTMPPIYTVESITIE